jgi:hypothetical protein
MTLKERIASFLHSRRGIKPTYGLPSLFGTDTPVSPTIVLQDDADGRGPYILQWNTEVLGPWPTVQDGFDSHQLHRSPVITS